MMAWDTDYGFVHADRTPNPRLTMAHELGHGAFGLDHPDAINLTWPQNFMNSGGGDQGEHVNKYQWQYIHEAGE